MKLNKFVMIMFMLIFSVNLVNATTFNTNLNDEGGDSLTLELGQRFRAYKNLELNSLITMTGVTGNTAKLYLVNDDTSSSLISTATITSNVATFSDTPTLQKFQEYIILIGSDGATYNRKFDLNSIEVSNDDLIMYAGGCQITRDLCGTAGYNIVSLDYTIIDSINYQGNTLIAWLPLNDSASPNPVNDLSWFGNYGTNNGATFTGTEADFDGTNDYISQPIYSEISKSSDYTISLKFKADDTTNEQFLLGQNIDSSNRLFMKIFNNKLGVGMYEGAYDYVETSFSDTSSFHHLVLVGNSGNYIGYLDGVSFTTNPMTINGIGGELLFTIGSGSSSDRFFNGKIKDVQIYDVALTSDEVSDLYTNDLIETTSLNYQMEAYWSLDNLTDSTPNGYDLTNYGATSTTGLINTAYNFDGTNDYMGISSISSLMGLTDQFTLNLWFKSDITSSLDNIFTTFKDANNRIACRIQSNELVCLAFNGGYVYQKKVTFTDTTSFHLLTIKGTGSEIKYYLDNVELTTSHSEVYLDGNSYLGRGNSPSGTTYFDGIIDEVAIYSRTLTSSQIEELYLRQSVDFEQYEFSNAETTPETPTPILTYNNITGNDETLNNSNIFNTSSITFETFVLNTSTNSNVNHTIYLNGVAIPTLQNINIGTLSNPINEFSLDKYCEDLGYDYSSDSGTLITNVNTDYWLDPNWIIVYGNGYKQFTCSKDTYDENNLNSSKTLSLSDNYYNISFSAVNNETSVNSSNYSFLVDATPPTFDIIGNLTQDEYLVDFSTIFNVSDALSGLASCTLNITYLEANESDSNFFINCTDSQLFSRAGLYNGFLTAIDVAGNSVTGSINGTINPLVNIFFYDENSTLITDYEVTIYHPNADVTTPTLNNDSSISLSPVNNGELDLGTHYLIFDKFGYDLFNASITLNETNAGQDFNVSVPFSRISISVYDISDFSLINETITLQILGDTFSNEYVFTESLNFTEIAMGVETYTLIASSTNYESVATDFNFDNQELISINLYMTPLVTNGSEVADLIVSVVDEYDTPQKDIVTYQFLWDSSQLEYIKQNQKTTDNNGQTSYKVFLNNRLYNFCAEYNNILYCETDLTININTNEVVIEIDTNGHSIPLNDTNIYTRDFSNSLTNVTTLIEGINYTSVTFTYNNPNLDVEIYCLEIYEVRDLNQYLEARQCSPNEVNSIVSHSSALSVNINENTNNSYVAKAVIYVGNDKRVLDVLKLYETYDFQEEFTLYGLAKIVILLLVGGVIGGAIHKKVHNVMVAHIGLPVISLLVSWWFPQYLSFDSVVIIGLINFIAVKLITNRDDVKQSVKLTTLTTILAFYIIFIFSLVVVLTEMDNKGFLDDYGENLKLELTGNQTAFKTFLVENEETLKLEQANAKSGAWDKITGVFLKTLEFLDTLFLVMENLFAMASNIVSILGISNGLLVSIVNVLDWVIVFIIVSLYYKEAVK